MYRPDLYISLGMDPGLGWVLPTVQGCDFSSPLPVSFADLISHLQRMPASATFEEVHIHRLLSGATRACSCCLRSSERCTLDCTLDKFLTVPDPQLNACAHSQLAAAAWFRTALKSMVPPDADEEEVQEQWDLLKCTAFFFKVRSEVWGSSFCRRFRDTSVMQSAP